MLRLIVSLFLLLSSQAVTAFSYTLEISEADIQEAVASMMPLEKQTFFATVIFSHPKIELAESVNKIGIYSQIDIAALGGIKSTGKTKITGALSYDSAKSEFFFKNLVIEEMKVDKVPDAYMKHIKKIIQVVASKTLSNMPIYKLKDGDLKMSLAKLAKSMLKSIVVENKQLLVELELF